MYLDVQNIGEEPLSFRREVPVGKLAWQYDQSVEVERARVEGQVFQAKGGHLLRGRLQAVARVPCARCLEPYELRLEASLVRIFVTEPEPLPRGGSEERKMQSDEVPLTGYDGRRIDLHSLAVEQVYLELPLKPICQQGCQGLCPRCGANRNLAPCRCSEESTDPRLAVLRTFLKRS